MTRKLFEMRPSPEKLFRFIVLLCLLGWGSAVIYVASHVAEGSVRLARSKDLASYCFTAIWIFVFFYAQYRLVPRFTKVSLNDRLGYVQSAGGAALLLVGALYTLLPQTTLSDVPSSMLLWTTLLGEGVFIGNVVWSYTHAGEPVPVLPVARSRPGSVQGLTDESAKNLGWPKSPVKLFGIGAAFFGAGGLVSLALNVPGFKVPVPVSGQVHFVPFGLLWFAAAAPFAIFALLYGFFMDSHNLVFEDRMNRIHFVVTILAVLDLVRVFAGWEQTIVSKTAALYFGPEFAWLYVLFGMSALVFAISAYRSYRRPSTRR